MRVFNAMEMLVEEMLDKNWTGLDLPCKCDQCKNDVYAITLNNVQPRYVSKDKGIAFVKAQYFDKQQETNLLIQMTKAADMVSKNPH